MAQKPGITYEDIERLTGLKISPEGKVQNPYEIEEEDEDLPRPRKPREWARTAALAAAVPRIASGFASGVMSNVPGLGTLGAGAVGGAGEALAQFIESGDPIDRGAVKLEAGLSAIPFGKWVSGGRKLWNAARGAGIIEAGNMLRRYHQEGKFLPDTPGAILYDLATSGVGAGAGAISTPLVNKTIGDNTKVEFPSRRSATITPGADPELWDKPVFTQTNIDELGKEIAKADTYGTLASDTNLGGTLIRRDKTQVKPVDPTLEAKPKPGRIERAKDGKLLDQAGKKLNERNATVDPDPNYKDSQRLVDAIENIEQRYKDAIAKIEPGLIETDPATKSRVLELQKTRDRAIRKARVNEHQKIDDLARKLEKQRKAEESRARAAKDREWKQEAANLNAAGKYEATKQAEETAAKAVEKAKAGLVEQDPVVTSTAKVKTPEGSETARRVWTKPKAEDPDTGILDDADDLTPPPTSSSPKATAPRVDPDTAKVTRFTTERAAHVVLGRTGRAGTVQKVGHGKYRIVYDEPDAPAAPKTPTTPDTPPPTPAGDELRTPDGSVPPDPKTAQGGAPSTGEAPKPTVSATSGDAQPKPTTPKANTQGGQDTLSQRFATKVEAARAAKKLYGVTPKSVISNADGTFSIKPPDAPPPAAPVPVKPKGPKPKGGAPAKAEAVTPEASSAKPTESAAAAKQAAGKSNATAPLDPKQPKAAAPIAPEGTPKSAPKVTDDDVRAELRKFSSAELEDFRRIYSGGAAVARSDRDNGMLDLVNEEIARRKNGGFLNPDGTLSKRAKDIIAKVDAEQAGKRQTPSNRPDTPPPTAPTPVKPKRGPKGGAPANAAVAPIAPKGTPRAKSPADIIFENGLKYDTLRKQAALLFGQVSKGDYSGIETASKELLEHFEAYAKNSTIQGMPKRWQKLVDEARKRLASETKAGAPKAESSAPKATAVKATTSEVATPQQAKATVNRLKTKWDNKTPDNPNSIVERTVKPKRLKTNKPNQQSGDGATQTAPTAAKKAPTAEAPVTKPTEAPDHTGRPKIGQQVSEPEAPIAKKTKATAGYRTQDGITYLPQRDPKDIIREQATSLVSKASRDDLSGLKTASREVLDQFEAHVKASPGGMPKSWQDAVDEARKALTAKAAQKPSIVGESAPKAAAPIAPKGTPKAVTEAAEEVKTTPKVNVEKEAQAVINAPKKLKDLMVQELEAQEVYGNLKDAVRAGTATNEQLRDAGKKLGEIRSALKTAIKEAEEAGETVPSRIKAPTKAPVQGPTRPRGRPKKVHELPAAEQPKAIETTIDRVKKFVNDEKGEITADSAAQLGLAITGAFLGAQQTPDAPWFGAVLGGASFWHAPSVVKSLSKQLNGLSGKAQTQSAKALGDWVHDKVEAFSVMAPEAYRAGLLYNARNLFANSVVGPYGTSMMKGIELTLSGDEAGPKILKQLASPTFFKKFAEVWGDAGTHIRTANDRAEITGKVGGPLFQKTVTLPARIMTAGDEAATAIMMQAGMPRELARKATLTSEPISTTGAAIGNYRKGKSRISGKPSLFLQITLPFYRTHVNQIEQGLMRVPGIGSYLRSKWKDTPIPRRQAIMQQVVMTPAAMGAGYFLGSVTPKQDQAMAMKFISNFTGQYGMLASMAFIAGVANQNGHPLGDQIMAGLREGLNTAPLPNTDLAFDGLKMLDHAQKGEWSKVQLPYGVLVPPVLSSKEHWSVPSLLRDPEGFFTPDGNWGRNKVKVTENEWIDAPFTGGLREKKIPKEKTEYQKIIELRRKQRRELRRQRRREY